MNRIYRLVWNRALRVTQVASELAHAQGGGVTGEGGTLARQHRLVTAICGVLGMGLAMPAMAAGPAASLIRFSTQHALTGALNKIAGKPVAITSSTTQSGTTWTVNSQKTVTTSSGQVDFNSFSDFNVAKGDTVNLDMTKGTKTLVNLVWGESNSQAMQIYGTVNSYANGQTSKIGGSVYFADPYGIVVGAGGVLNVGALSLSAPSMQVMNNLLGDANGATGGDSDLTSFLQGQEALADGSGSTCADGKSALICVDGTINAANAVRIHATTIDVSGNIDVSGAGTDMLATAVNVDGAASPTIVTDGNTIRLVAQDSNATDGTGGDAASNAAVTVSGTLTTASSLYDNSAYAKTMGTTGNPDASSSWGDIALNATAGSTSAYTDPTKSAAAKSTGALLLDQGTFDSSSVSDILNDANSSGVLQTDANLAASDTGVQLAYARSFSTANVELLSGANVKAGGNVVLQAGTTTATSGTETAATASDSKSPISAAGFYGAVYSKANALVDTGASVTSGGDVTVKADTDNSMDVSASSTATATNSVVGATVAWTQAAVDADAQVDGAVTANTLDIGAHNSNDFGTDASASTSNGSSSGSIGLAGAVSRQTIAANAYLGGTPTINKPTADDHDPSGDITIAAETDTTKNETSAATGTVAPAPAPTPAPAPSGSGNLTGTMGNVTQDADGSGSGKGLGSALPFKIGSAVAWTDSSNTATAATASGLSLTTPGNLVVQAIVSNAGIHNGAKSDTASAEDSGAESSGSDSGSTANVSAAIAYANYQNTADAEIGSRDDITALNIGVNAQVVVPFDWTFGQGSTITSDWDALENTGGGSLDDFTSGLKAIPNLVTTAKGLPDAIMDGTSGFAAASGDGSTVTIGGAVNYFGMSNASRAWVGSGSKLKSTASAPASGGSESWTSSLDWLTGAVADQNISNSTTPADADTTTTGAAGTSTFTWGKSVDVLAGTHVAAFNLVGDLTPWATKAESAAFGGAFNYGGYDDSATAGVDADTGITSTNSVAVNATGADTLFVLSPISGQASGKSSSGTVAMLGTVALTDVTESTHATLSGSDTIDAGALDVDATNPVMVWALSGAVATSSEASVGLSVGINDIDTSTVADIGDNSGDESSTPATAPAETGGTITTDALAVNAATSGEAGSLSVAGTSVSSSSSGSGSGSSTSGSSQAPTDANSSSSAPGSGLISMLKSVTSIADKANKTVGTLQDALGKVDEMSSTEQTVSNDLTGSDAGSGSGSTSSLLDTASNDLGKVSSGLSTVSSAGSGLQGIVSKLGSLNKKSPGSSSGSGSGSGSSSGSSATFGIGVSGAASVDMASLGTQSGVDGVTVTTPTAQVTSTNDAQLYSAAGSAALVRAGQSSSINGALAGTVAYSNVADSTTATIGDSGTNPVTTIDAGTVAVQAVDSSMQVDAGIGAAASTGGSGTNVALAGSVSIGASNNQTTASVDDATLTGTGASTDSAQVTAYDASEIGIGAGALSFSNGSGTNVNGALSLTWAQIKDDTNATVDGGSTISGYGNFSLNALDTAQIVAVAATGSLATGENGLSLTGAVTWSDVENATVATVDGGADIGTNGNISVLSEAIDSGNALVTTLGLPTPQAATSYYDFSGDGLSSNGQTINNGLSSNISAADSASQNAAGTANNDAGTDGSSSSGGSSTSTSTGSTGIGNSIIAVAGDLSSASNDVGMSLAYNHVANSHQVVIDDATLASANGSLDLNAQDDTRIIGIALGVGVSTGDFAGIGSATVSSIANQDQVSLGSASASDTTLKANIINANASDSSSIYTLAGGVGVSTDGVGAGAAVTYNSIGNTIGTEANNVAFTTDGDDTAPATTDPVYDLGLQASNSAKIMTGAVAVGAGDDAGLSISFGWNQTSNTVEAGMSGGSLVNLAQGAGTAGDQGTLGIIATDDATIQALSGSVGLGDTAGVAAAASVQEIGDSTQATLANAGLQTDDVTVDASTTATEQSIALGAAIGGDGSGTASVAYNCIGDGGVSDGGCSGSGGDAGTQASVTGITGAGGSGPAVIGNALNVGATDDSSISTLAVDVAVGGDAAVGAAVGVSAIGTTTSASIGTAAPGSGSDTALTTLDVGNQTNVDATSNASIESLAAGVSGSGDASVAGSSTANNIDNTISASMTNVSTGTVAGADPLAATSSGVTSILAINNTQIGSLAGALAGSGSVAIGAAVAVNDIGTNTTATFDGDGGTPTTTVGNVGDWYQTGSLIVDAAANNPGTATGLFGSGSSLASDNANIQTIAVAGSAAGTGALSGSVAINQIGGSTDASIGQDANVVADDNVGVLASSNQGINVYAGAAALGGDVGLGAGVVVNTLNSNTNAYIDDSDVNADANGAALTVANGTPSNAPTVSTSLTGNGSPSAPDLDSATTSVHGLAVNASNEQHASTLSVGVGASGGIAGAAEVGVNQIGGTTSAYIDNGSLINALPDNNNPDLEATQQIDSAQQVNVTAYNAQYASNYLMAAAGSGGVSITAAAPVNTFDGHTKGYIDGSTVDSRNSTNGTQVQADSYQWSLNNVGGVAVSVGDGAAANLDGAISLFQSATDAYVNDSSILANNFSTLANSQIQSAQIGGALAVAVGEFSGAGTGMALVNVDDSETSAEVTNMQSFVDNGSATVQATSSDSAAASGSQLAGGTWAGLAGTIAVNILQDSTTALLQNDGSMTVGGALDVTANNTQNVADSVGGVAIGAAGVGGDINVTLLQTSVLANIDDSSINNTGSQAGGVDVAATSTRNVDNQATSIAAGAVGVGVSVGVLIAGTGSDLQSGSGNSNIDWLDNASASPTASNNGQTQQQVTLANVSQFGSQGSLSGTDSNGNAISYGSLGVNNASSVNGSGNFSLSSALSGTNDGINAAITNGSSIATSNSVDVTSQAIDSTSNQAGAGAGGAVAAGVSVAYTKLDSQVGALVDSTSKITQAQDVTVQSTVGNGTNGDAASTAVSSGGSAGNVTVGAISTDVAVADSEIGNTVTAEDAGNVAGSGKLAVTASDGSTANAGNSNPNVTVGIGVAATAVNDTASRNDTIGAWLDAGSTTSGFGSVQVAATDNGSAIAEGVAGAGGAVSATGADITAQDNSSVASGIGSNIPAGSTGTGLVTTLSDVGNTSVSTDAAPTLSATANTTTIGVGLAIGVNDVNATADIAANAQVGSSGSDVQFLQPASAGDGLLVSSTFAPSLTAWSTGNSGGIVAGDASDATASSSGSNNAEIGSGVMLPLLGDVSINATSTPDDSATAKGVVGGLIIGGGFNANAESDETTTASLDGSLANLTVTNAQTGQSMPETALDSLSVKADTTDTNDAYAKSGSGALIGGTASNATTSSLSTSSATLGANQYLTMGGEFNLVADTTYQYGLTADSTSGSLVGGTGANATNTAGPASGYTASASIGAGTTVISGGNLDVRAATMLDADGNNNGATAGAGGGISGAGGSVNNTFTADNFAHVGNGDYLETYGYDSGSTLSSLNVVADTDIQNENDQADITDGGAVSVAHTTTSFTANATNTVDIDENSDLSSYTVNIGTYAQLTAQNTAIGNSAGLDGVADTDSSVALTANQTVNVGTDASGSVPTTGATNVNISSAEDTYVLAGDDFGEGFGTQLNASPVAQSFVRAFIAIPVAKAEAKATSNASMTLGQGSTVISDGDVDIGSINGALVTNPDSEGHGYELGFIPVTDHDNATSASGASNTAVNGTVVAGKGGDLLIDIDANGNLASNAADYGVVSSSGLQTLGNTENDGSSTTNGASTTPGTATPSEVTFAAEFDPGYQESQAMEINGQSSTQTSTVPAWVFSGSFDATSGTLSNAPLSVRGGNVYLYGGTGSSTNQGGITGSGAVTANPSPSITIDNASTDSVVLSGVDVGFGLSGSVFQNNASTFGTPRIGGITITQAPSDAQSNVTVLNSFQGNLSGSQPAPDIVVTGDIQDFGGNVSLTTYEGSVITHNIFANAVKIIAPLGNVIFLPDSNGDPLFSGGDPASVLQQPGNGGSNWLYDILEPDFFSGSSCNLYNTSCTGGSWDADKVAAALVEAVYAPNSNSAGSLNGALMSYNNGETTTDANGNPAPFQRTPVITYGNCVPDSSSNSCNNSGDSGIGYGVINVLPGSGGWTMYTPSLPWIQLNAAATPASPWPYVRAPNGGLLPAMTGSNVPGISSTSNSFTSSHSQTLTVDAGAHGYIDFDSAYTVGQSGVWTVQTQQGLNDFLSAYAQNSNTTLYSSSAGTGYQAYGSAAGNGTISLTDGTGNTLYYLDSAGQYEPLLGLVQSAGSSQLIGASYNVASKQIDLDSVEANGGGQATLIGHVVSTGGGSINVNSGYGEVLVDNTTGIPLQVNNINTGSGSAGLVMIEDYSQPLTNANGQLIRGSNGDLLPTTTWYVSEVGDPVETFTNNQDAYGLYQGISNLNFSTPSNLPSIVAKSAPALLGTVVQVEQSNGDALTTYQPEQGQYYNYGMYATVTRSTNPLAPYTTSSGGYTDWSFINPATGGIGNGDQAWTTYAGFSNTADEALTGNNLWAVGISAKGPIQTLDGMYSVGWDVFHGCGSSIGSSCHYGTSATDIDYYDKKGHPVYGSAWDYVYPYQGTLNIGVTQNASQSIAVNFATTTTNRVEIDSNANILLNGVIANTNVPVVDGTVVTTPSATPDTLLIASNGGSILQVNPQTPVAIWTHDLAMVAEGGGSIGTAGLPGSILGTDQGPIHVQLSGYCIGSSANCQSSTPTMDSGTMTTLTAITDGNVNGVPAVLGALDGGDGSINLDINSGNYNQPIKAIAQGTAADGSTVYGNIDITSTGSLVSESGPGVQVAGQSYIATQNDLACQYAGPACILDPAMTADADSREDVVGQSVTLVSQGGGIYASQQAGGETPMDKPLLVQTNFAAGEPDTLNLDANGDIDVANDSTDYDVGGANTSLPAWLQWSTGYATGGVVSVSGNVILDAEHGGIYDASDIASSSTLTAPDEINLWAKYGLLSVDKNGQSTGALTAVDKSVVSQVNSAYNEYMGLLAEGSYANGSFTFNASLTTQQLAGLLAAYWPFVANASNGKISASATPDVADVEAYLGNRIAGDEALFNQWIGSSWNTKAEFASEPAASAAYTEYTSLLALGSYSNGTYTFNGTPSQGLLQSYWPAVVQASNGALNAGATPNVADVEAYLGQRIAADTTVLNEYDGELGVGQGGNPAGQYSNPDGSYVFALTAAQQQSLSSSAWGVNQLLYSLAASGMGAASSGTGTGGLTTTLVGNNFQPNIIGHDVTLLASGTDSGLGRLGSPVQIDEADLQNLYDTGKFSGSFLNGDGTTNTNALDALLNATTPGDIAVYAQTCSATACNPNDVVQLTSAQLADLANGLSIGGTGAGGDSVGYRIDHVSITQTDPLFLDVAGDFAGKASGAVYLQDSGNLVLAAQQQAQGELAAGAAGLLGVTSGGDMDIEAYEGIQADPGVPYRASGPALLTVGGNLVIAGNDNVGFDAAATDPLPVAIAGELTKGSAGESLALMQVGGDLLVNQAVANDDVLLQAPDGSLYTVNDATSIAGNQITLDALDSIAYDSTLGDTPTLGALLVQQTGSDPLLNADATNGQVDIATDTGDLDLGNVQAGSEITLLSTAGSLSAQQLTSTNAGIFATGYDNATFDNVQVAGGVNLNATTGALATTGTLDSSGTAAVGLLNPNDDVVLNGATGVAIGGNVTAGTGNIDATVFSPTLAGMLEIDPGFALDAAKGNIALSAQAAGDAVQMDGSSSVTAGGSASVDAGGDVRMASGSSITAAGTATVDAGGDVLLGLVQSTDASDDPAIGITAGGSIQGNGDPLNVQERSGGSVALQSVDDIGSASLPLVVDVDTLGADSTQGSIYLDALGDITATSLTSAGDTSLQAAQDATVQQANVGGMLSIASTNGAVTLTQGMVGGASTLDAATNITVDTLQGGNGLTTQSSDATTLGTVTLTGGNLQSTAGTTLAAQQIDVQDGNATLASTGDMTLDSVTTSGNLDATAGTDLTAATLSSGGSTSLTATNGELQVTSSLTSGGDTALQSGGDTDIAALTVGGNLTADSGGSIGVAQGTVTGTGNLDAADDLTLGTWNEGNDLTTQSGGATSLGAVVLSGGNLQSTAGGDLTAQSVDVQDGNAKLDAGGDMTLASVTTSGELDATATGNLQATALKSGGDTTLDAGKAMTLGNVSAGKAFAATAGTNLTAATLASGGDTVLTATAGTLQVTKALTSGGNATLRSGGDTDIAALTVGGNLTANSGGSIDVAQGTVAGTGDLDAADNLTLGTWNEGNDLTTQSGEATSFGDVTLSGGNLQSTAGTTLAAQQIDVQAGNATLASTGDMTLGSVTTSGDLDAKSGADLQATTLQSGGDTTLQSAQAMTLGTASAGGNLDATAGTDLTAATLSSGGSTSLTATNGELQVTSSLTSGGDTTLQSGADTDIAALTVGGNLTADSGGSIDVAQGTVAGTGNLDAADDLTLGTWNEGNDLTTQSGEATSFGDVTLSGGNLQSTAGTTLAAQQIDVQAGNATLASTGDMTLGSATTSGNLDAKSGADLQATTLQSGGDTTLQSAQAMTLGTANSGGSVEAIAGTNFAATTIDAATDVGIQAGGTVQTTQVQAGHDVDVNAGGDVGMVTTTAGHDIDVDSGGALTMHDATAGDAVSLAAQTMTFDDVQAPNTITLLARDGNILAGSLTTRDAYAEANGDIVLDAGYIGDRINLGANDITAYVKQTSTGQPLYSDLTGYQGSVANRITVDADASQRWMIDRLAAVQAALTTSAPNADIASGTIIKTMSLDTSKARVRMNQQSPLLVLADVQLMQPTYDFQLYQDGIHTLTDAFVIRYGYGFQIETPNYVADHAWMDPDYLGESALRNNGRFLDTDDESDDSSSGQTKRAIPHWIRTNKDSLVQPAPSSDSVDVNLQAPE